MHDEEMLDQSLQYDGVCIQLCQLIEEYGEVI